MLSIRHSAFVLCVVTLLSISLVAAGEDWPGFRGADRTGKSSETNLLTKWPVGGPKLLWTSPVNVGKGYASAAIAKGVIYTTGMLGSDGYVFALDLSGKEKWKKKYGREWNKKRYGGTRSTPTIDDGLLYIISTYGQVVCMDAKTGNIKWSIDTGKEFGAKPPNWGIAESILIDGDNVICVPGGTKATVLALNKKTGATVWQTRGLSDKSAYCAPMLIDDGARKLIVTATSDNIIGVNRKTGALLWKYPYRNRWSVHPNCPPYKDGRLFVTSGYGSGGVMLQLSADGKSLEKKTKKAKKFSVQHGGVVMIGEYVYGATDSKQVACVKWDSLAQKKVSSVKAKGSIIAANGMLYVYAEGTGTVSLIKAAPDGSTVAGQFKVTQGSGQHWAHPAISDGRLYIRHGGALMAYDIRKP